MLHENEQVLKAFRLYTKLSREGIGDVEDLRLYLTEDAVRGLVEQFVREVDGAVLVAGDHLYLIPMAMTSPFHVKNASLKKEYLGVRSKNSDLYLMYLAIIVLIGEFYDSYQTNEMTRDFLSTADWLASLDNRMQALKEHDPEELKALDHEYEYNWTQLVEKWDALDDLRESSRQQDGRTLSRLGFLSQVRSFLLAQELIVDLGNDEITLTEKARTIVQRYYMEIEYNRGILEFISGLEKQEAKR